MGEEGEVHVPYLSRLFYGLSNICSFMACLALLEILIPISLIDSIPHQVYSLNCRVSARRMRLDVVIFDSYALVFAVQAFCFGYLALR